MENPPFFDYGKGRQHFLLSPLDYPPASAFHSFGIQKAVHLRQQTDHSIHLLFGEILRHAFHVAADPVPVIDHGLHPLIRKNEPLGSGIVRVRHLGDISSPDEAAGCMVCRLSADTQVITDLGDGPWMAPFSYGGQKPHIRAV